MQHTGSVRQVFGIATGQIWQAVRSLLRRPALAFVALLTLALGIGANTAIFSVINAVLLKPLPFTDPDRLVMVWSTAPNQGLVEGFSSYPDFDDWREQSTAFHGLAAFWTFPNGDVNLTGGTEPQRVSVARVSPGFFEILGVAPLHGRTFHAEESVMGNHRRAILSYGLWRRDFGADPGLVGRDVLVNGFPYTVVGIMPPELQSRTVRVLATDVQLWRPLVPEDNQTGGRGVRRLRVVGRLAAEVTLPRAEAELAAIATRLAEAYPGTNRDAGIRLVPLREQVVRDVKRALMFLLAAVGVVLVGACANVANLLLIKAAGSRKRMAIQQALGASRFRLGAEVLAESVVLGGLGALLGILLAFAGVKTFVALGPADIPLLSDAAIDGPVLGFTLIVTLLTVVLVGLVPAWRSSRSDVMDVLRQGGRQSRGTGDRRSMGLLTISQIALAMVLLTAGGLLIRNFQALLRVDPGLDPRHVLTFQLELPMGTSYRSQDERTTFFGTLLERLKALPGVRAVSIASAPPFEDAPDERSVFSFTRPGLDEHVRANVQLVEPGYFALLGIPLIQGRGFDVTDGRSAPLVAIVSTALGRSVWGSASPIGARIDLPSGGHATVVGVAGDVRARGLDRDVGRTVYLAAAQRGYNFMTVIIKRANDSQPTTATIRTLVADLDPTVPLHHVRTLDELVATSIAQQRFHMLLAGAFSLLIFVLAIIGTYSVASYGVSERTGELALRIALGATRGDIRGLVLGEGARLALVGIVVGGAAAVALSQVLTRFVFQISTLDVLAFVVAPLLLASSVLVATYLPARRATRVDPMRVLRAD